MNEIVDPRYRKGLLLFNAGNYFESHEVLEDLWRDSSGEIRDFYKGLIQIGAAFYQLKRGRLSASRKILETATCYLEKYPAQTLGLNVTKLTPLLRLCIQAFLKADPEKFKQNPSSFDAMIPVLDFNFDSY